MCKICVCIYTYIFRYFLHSILTQFQGGTNEVKHGTWHFLMAKVLRQNLDQTLPKSDSSNLDIVKLPSFHKYRANSLAAIYINNCQQFLPKISPTAFRAKRALIHFAHCTGMEFYIFGGRKKNEEKKHLHFLSIFLVGRNLGG